MKKIPSNAVGKRLVIVSTSDDYEDDQTYTKRGFNGYIVLGANPVNEVAIDGSEAKFGDSIGKVGTTKYKRVGVLLGCIPHREARGVLGSADDVRNHLDSVFRKYSEQLKELRFCTRSSSQDPTGTILIYFGKLRMDKYGKYTLQSYGRHGYPITSTDPALFITYNEMVDAVVEFFSPYYIEESEAAKPEYILDLNINKLKDTKDEIIKKLRQLTDDLSSMDTGLISRFDCVQATLNTVKNPAKYHFDPVEDSTMYVVVGSKSCINSCVSVHGPYPTKAKAVTVANRLYESGRGRIPSIAYQVRKVRRFKRKGRGKNE